MSKMSEEQVFSAMAPAALRSDLTGRFLSAMQHASAEEGEDELELRLRRLRPAALGPVRSQEWLLSMQGALTCRYSRGAWYSLRRWGAAAALFVLCSAGGLFMVNSSAWATVPSGLACRSVIDSRTGNAVHWQEGQTALRPCDVLYEDSFVLDGEENSTITVRVPVRTRVMIEEEVI